MNSGGKLRGRSFVMVVAAVAMVVGLVTPANAAPPLPSSMAAIGDSITQAFDVCCIYGDHPGKSWSTGTDQGDTILSQYERILASNPAIAGNGHNDAVTGATMADAAGQAATAVSQQVQYVTILMGANDACTSSIDTMTSVADFQARFQAAMDTLEAGLPADAHVFVASVPNVYRLWKVLHTNLLAQAVWAAAQICQSLLSTSNTEQERRTVALRVRDFNTVLAAVCAQYANCLYDGSTVFNFAFKASQVSTLDYFHPSVYGQTALARVTWTASWWPGT
jgi:lysophospholipase L1-like esterase